MNVARAWTLAWAIMSGREAPPDEIPDSFLNASRGLGYERTRLRDDYLWPSARHEMAEEALQAVLRRIRQTIFPIHGL